MANTISIKVDLSSLANTIQRLGDLDRKAVKPAIRKGINEVTKAILWEARRLVPKRTGLLRKSLGRFVEADKRGGYVGIVRPRKGFKVVVNGKTIDARRYAHLVEHGRSPVIVKKKKVLSDGDKIFGTRVAGVGPRPFMMQAWSNIQPAVLGIMAKWLNEAMAKAWNKARSRYSRAA